MFHVKEQPSSHLQTHDSNRPELQCGECGKRLNTRLGLRRHVAAHAAPTAAADLACKVCRRLFDSTPALLEHLSVHAGRPPPDGAARERKHQCDSCGRRFFTRKDVRRHAVVHTGRRDFLCPRCAQRFGRRDHLTRHLKKSHAQELDALGAAPPSGAREEPSPAACISGSSPRDASEAVSVGAFGPRGPQGVSASGFARRRPAAPAPLQSPVAVGCYFEPGKHQAPQYHEPQRYQPASASTYLKAEMENFLNELQCGPMPPQATAATSASRPNDLLPESLGGQSAHFTLRNSAFVTAEPAAANVDLSPLLGFLPFGLPPYSAPLSSGGIVMGYSTTTAACSPTPTSQLSGPLSPFQPLHEPQASGPLNQLPGFSPTLPRFHQAFQQ